MKTLAMLLGRGYNKNGTWTGNKQNIKIREKEYIEWQN